MLRRVLVALVLAPLGCAPHAERPTTAAAHAAAAPPSTINTDEEFVAARADLEALKVGAADRSARRRTLETWALGRLQRGLDGGHLEEAFEQLKQAATLYDADELRGRVNDAPLVAAAEKIERAFRRRGAHQEVLLALAVQISGSANERPARARYDQVSAWLRGSTRGDGSGPPTPSSSVDGRERLIDDLEAVARLWPSPFVVGELTALYFERQAEGGRPRRHGVDLRELLSGAGRPSASYNLARLYLRISRPADALAQLRKLGPGGDDPQLRTLLEKLNAPTAQPGDAVALAMLFAQQGGREDVDVAERICRDGARRFASALEPRLCAGQLALSLDRLVVALHEFEDAVRLDPSRREAWESLAKLYQLRLSQIANSDENLNVDELEAQLHRVEEFHAKAAQRFPDKPIRPSMAGALFEVGRGYYNTGRLGEASRYLARSIGLDQSAAALELLGQIRLKKGDPKQAEAQFERAIAVPQADRPEQDYWRAKLRRQLADAAEADGDQARATTTRKEAIADWDKLLGLPGLNQDIAAEASVEKAKMYYQLGDRDAALESFEKAIDLVPDRGSTYADVISFLVQRGELEEALDAYHRALGRSEVNDYLKVYCSLWIVDLARRAGQPEDPLATSYLKSTDGGKWYDDLARFATGRADESLLVARADSPGKKAESAFYRAMRALGKGDVEAARALWRQVLDTDMLAFFEYDMASLYLKMGTAPAEPILKSRPAARERPRSRPADGSI
jgi:tetratricopeptide (TPR) repeat protein